MEDIKFSKDSLVIFRTNEGILSIGLIEEDQSSSVYFFECSFKVERGAVINPYIPNPIDKLIISDDDIFMYIRPEIVAEMKIFKYKYSDYKILIDSISVISLMLKEDLVNLAYLVGNNCEYGDELKAEVRYLLDLAIEELL